MYCLESVDLHKGNSVFGVAIATDAKFKVSPIRIGNSKVVSLETTLEKTGDAQWKDVLYKEVSKKPSQKIASRLIPYYAWGNRGHTEMSVWLPVIR